MSLRDDVLDRTDIVDLVSKYVDIKKAGKNRLGLCPFHKEKSPSFTVAEDKQIFKCFWCGKGGNAITFHMEVERIDFWDSLKSLAESASIDVSSYQKDPEKQAADKSVKEKQKLMNKRTQQFFQQHFPGSVAQSYALDQRGLSEATIGTFGLGYAPDSYHDQIVALRAKWFDDNDLIQAWLAKTGKNSGETYAFFRHRLTFPIHDHIGNIVWFGARALDADQNPKYLNTTETAIYNKSKILFGLDKAKNNIKSYESLIIVEWYMDVIALHQHGLPIGIATCGTALTTAHTKLISRHTPHLIFAFDNDSAGFEATIRWLKVAYEQDLYPKVLIFPAEYKDVDDWLSATQKNTETRNQKQEVMETDRHPEGGTTEGSSQDQATQDNEEVWKEKLKEISVDGFGWVIGQYQIRYDLDNPVERKKVVQNLFELLSKIEDYSILQMYFTKVAKELSMNEEQLWKQFRQWIKKSSVRNSTYREEEETRPDSSSKIAEKYLLWALVHQWFALKLWADNAIYTKYEVVLKQLAQYFPTTVLAEVYSGSLSPSTQESLVEAEMFWELQVADTESDKITSVVQQFLHQQIYKLQRVVMKSKKLDHTQKQELLAKIRGL